MDGHRETCKGLFCRRTPIAELHCYLTPIILVLLGGCSNEAATEVELARATIQIAQTSGEGPANQYLIQSRPRLQQLSAALAEIKVDGRGEAMSDVADMRAPDVRMTIEDSLGQESVLAFYGIDGDQGAVVMDDLFYSSASGLNGVGRFLDSLRTPENATL